MKLLFIQGGTRLKQDNLKNWYTDGNFNGNVWKRYTVLCDKLTVLLRREEKIYDMHYATVRFNKFDTESIELIPLEDIYSSIYKACNPILRRKVYNQIEKEVEKCDKAVIRSVVNFYTVSAVRACIKLRKTYAIEVTGVGWDGSWYHGIAGKLSAPFIELRQKKFIASAPYALYVTQNELQQRYPCKGKTVGCSNVELYNIDSDALRCRNASINENRSTFIIGTIGNYNLKTKGQQLVIKALSILKKKNIQNIEYQIVGSGDELVLKSLSQKNGLEDNVKFLGTMPHDQIFKWLDNIDIYIQPSYQEGLCRSVIEAMSRACPVICSDACGERELANEQFIFRRGDFKELSRKILLMVHDHKTMELEAKRSFEKSFDYEKSVLDNRRTNFYSEFVSK